MKLFQTLEVKVQEINRGELTKHLQYSVTKLNYSNQPLSMQLHCIE